VLVTMTIAVNEVKLTTPIGPCCLAYVTEWTVWWLSFHMHLTGHFAIIYIFSSKDPI